MPSSLLGMGGTAATPLGPNQAVLYTRASSQYLTIPNNAAQQTGDIDFTIAFWCKFTTHPTATLSDWASRCGASGEYEYLIREDGNLFQFFVSPDGTSLVGTPAIQEFLSADVWYFVVCWHDSVANTINIRLHDTITHTTSHSGGVFVANTPTEFGRSIVSGGYCNGAQDAARRWNRVLTSAEMTQLFNGGVPSLRFVDFTAGLKVGLVSSWEYDEDSGIRYDSYGSSNLTAVNGPTAVPVP